MRTIIALSLVFLVGITASAQTFDVTISASLPFTAAGPSPEGLTAAVEVRTESEGWKITARADLGLMPFKFSTLTLMSSTTFYGISFSDVSVIDFQNPVKETTTLSTKLDQFNLSLTINYSYPLMEFWKIAISDVTLGVQTTSAEGVQLSSATTLTLEGVAKQAFSVGLSVQGVSITRTTELTKTGLSAETWVMSLNVAGFSVRRTTVYTAEGFASDTLTIGKQFGDYAFVGRAVFDKTGWASKTITLSTAYQQLDLSATLVLTPAGFQGGSLSASTTLAGIRP
ncbi:MAG: hypothetical protein NZ610_00920 [Candidatus Bipolaricaulota bacterium]|nr:hypothetical protein [Candidatus Bipolaricaulota bacterium]MCS7273958.1 hypothetical protein [Candidatus Bipolaricaulota bacterium]MDW8111018.1 hypothetical protein [Candidatus Bipolaricaulota bacterium]MDW8329283.1 hypothetical protein [Candidatus Bipolaricaulota bacterium]